MNRRLVRVLLVASAILASCSRPRVAPVAVAAPAADPAPPPHPEPATPFAAWLRTRLPAGGTIVAADSGKLSVEHTVAAGDTALTIAKAYLDLTDVYWAKDLAAQLTKTHPDFRPGSQIEIPHLLSEPYPSPDEGRIAWPADRALKGVFITGIFAGGFWSETIDKVATHGMNAIVLDAKDYMGPVTYPTKVQLALETGAAKDPPIADYARAIRFAHARGILIIARIPCFHDPWAAKHAPRLSLMNKSGRPFEMGWTDPANVEAQDYVIDLVKEAIELGADEIQLDYVRFPVQAHGISNAAMPAPDGHRTQAMKAFVHRVHEVTQAKHVPLSLDLFGVTATGEPSDIEALGQNLSALASESEAVSPMVYPSHYAPGWNGFAVPGAHPEIIGIGTKAALDKLRAGHVKGAIVRPWLQASSFKTPNYGPQYVLDEIKSAETSGAVGWLFWDPANSYWPVWKGLPRVDRAGGH